MRLWDLRVKRSVHKTEKSLPLTAFAFGTDGSGVLRVLRRPGQRDSHRGQCKRMASAHPLLTRGASDYNRIKIKHIRC
jgi:hypothetical protein